MPLWQYTFHITTDNFSATVDPKGTRQDAVEYLSDMFLDFFNDFLGENNDRMVITLSFHKRQAATKSCQHQQKSLPQLRYQS